MSKRASSVCLWTAAFLAALGLLMLLSEKVLALDLSYGGRLSSPSGEPVAGPVDITFHFYRDASGGSVLVSVSMANMPLVDGIFQTSIPLSAVEAERLFEDGDQTVYVEVESRGRIYPRQKFSYVPLALRVPVDGSKIVYDAEGRLTFGPGASTGTGNLNGISGIGGVERLPNGSYATFGLSSSGKSLLGAADSGVQRSLLGLGSMATRNGVALSDLPSCADGSVLRFSASSWSCAVLGPSTLDAAIDAAEFAALNGVTSSIQTQLNSKLSASGGTVTGSLTLSQGSELRLATSNAGVSAGFKAPSNMATSTIYCGISSKCASLISLIVHHRDRCARKSETA